MASVRAVGAVAGSGSAGLPPMTAMSPERPLEGISNLAPVAPSSEEFSRLEYFLQLSLQSTACRVHKVMAVANPHLTMQFEARSAGLLVHDSWVDLSRLAYENSLPELCARGFKVPPAGLLFTVGTVTVQDFGAASTTGTGGRRLNRFVLCKVAVGKAYRVNESALHQTQAPALPQGFDSFYVVPDADRREDTSGYTPSTPSQYRHQYAVLDGTAILPCYVVEFEYDPEADAQRRRPLCDVCEAQPAALFCRQDSVRLCNACDQQLHSANKVVARHIRVPLNDQPQGFGNCATHHLPVEFYCPQCHQPVCVHCKMIGNHATGETALHKLTSVADAYRDAVTAAAQEDPLLLGRQQALRAQMTQIEERMSLVKQNATEAEEALYRILQEALYNLQSLTDKKMSSLAAAQIEVQRQLEHVNWMESFLKLQKEALSPLEFLRAWDRHIALRAEVHTMLDVRPSLDVDADLEVEGRVSVTTRAERQRQAMQYGPAYPTPYALPGSAPGAVGAAPVPPAPAADAAPGLARYASTATVGATPVLSAAGVPMTPAPGGVRMSMTFGNDAAATAAATAAAGGPSGVAAPPVAAPMAATPVGPAGYAAAGWAQGDDNPQLRSTADFWVETLRRRKQEQALRQRYDELQNLVTAPDMLVARWIAACTPLSEADDVARALVFACEASKQTLALMQQLVAREIQTTDQATSLLRQTTFFTKALNVYSVIVGSAFLRNTLGPMISWICENSLAMEVDPDRVPAGTDLQANMRQLTNTSQMFMERIMQSFNSVPFPIRYICSYLAQAAKERFGGYGNTAVAAYFFLRYVCPAIVVPEQYGVVDIVPSDTARRNLTLVAKVLQKLGSGITFKKEPHFADLNPYILNNIDAVAAFLDRLANVSGLPLPAAIPSAPITPEMRLDALAVLHRHLSSLAVAAPPVGPQEPEGTRERVEQLVTLLASLGPAPERPASYNIPFPSPQMTFL